MSEPRTGAQRARADAIGEALEERARAAHDAQVEYSEAMHKIYDRFESERAEALEHYREAVTPAHREANAAMIRAEQEYPED